jgi:hypothetical protein
LSRTSTFLVSCPKGQVEKYVNVEACNKNWEAYRRQRNYVTKLKSKSINTYFIERCAGGPKSKDFWPTVKSFLTNKGNVNQKDTVLSENDVLITKQDEVCEIFNIFFC